jgi:NADP-reducing hydrogenase subunit HndB
MAGKERKKLTIKDLDALRKRAREATSLREGTARARITVHMGTCGIASGARDIMQALLDEMEARKPEGVVVTTSGCAGLCSREPMVTVEILDHPPIKYVDLTGDKVRKIFIDHVLGGNVVKEYVLAVGSETTH